MEHTSKIRLKINSGKLHVCESCTFRTPNGEHQLCFGINRVYSNPVLGTVEEVLLFTFAIKLDHALEHCMKKGTVFGVQKQCFCLEMFLLPSLAF